MRGRSDRTRRVGSRPERISRAESGRVDADAEDAPDSTSQTAKFLDAILTFWYARVVTTGTPRSSGTEVDPDPATADPVAAPRSRPVRGRTADVPPTTAQVIRRTDASIARPVYAGLGVALHHFTDELRDRIDPFELHRATSVLTKQVRTLLGGDDPLTAIRQLVTDPRRVAMPDGRRAAEVCGDAWDEIRALADERAAASCDGADEFGREAIVNLAAVRGVGADRPGWGTAAWRDRVDRAPLSPDERTLLHQRPELADDDLLSMVIDDADPDSPDPRSTATASADDGTVAAGPGRSRPPRERITREAPPAPAVVTR